MATPITTASTPTTTVTYGAALTFETIAVRGAESAPVRVRATEETLLRVIEGVVHLVVGDEERDLGIYEEARIAAGTAHVLWSTGRGEARVVEQFRPVAGC